ncbi:MAG: cytochrome c peroxidase [Crocinitomicaceae bacterium]
MNKHILLFVVFIAIGSVLCSVQFKIDSEINPILIPDNWPDPVYNFSKKPLKAKIIEIGRSLFYDPILSLDNSISCSSCHLSFTAFTHVDHALSHGIGDSIGTRNSPVLINLAWNKYFMWDGAINHIEVQALAPISHPAEMGEDLNRVLEKLRHSKKYQAKFYAAFKDSSISSKQLLIALAQFQLTLISSNSKYDKVKRKEVTFTKQEKSGYKLFKKHCSSCHKEPLFTSGEFENNGLPIDPTLNDIGRGKITQLAMDDFKFKVPTLRNIEFSFPYMHDGRFKSLSEVLNHYTSGVSHTANLSSQLVYGIDLTSNERVDIVSFLLTLTDKEFLFNPDYQFPKN